MTKEKYLFIILFVAIALFFIPNSSDAAVESTRVFERTGGYFTLELTGLELDTTHEYQYGLVRTTANEVEQWIDIVDYTATTASIDIGNTYATMQVARLSDTGYLTIMDITDDTVVLEDYEVDLTPDLLKLVNCSSIENGQNMSTYEWECGFYTTVIDHAQYQYIEITDQNIIDRYNEIKESGGDVYEMKDMLSTEPPTSNWTDWDIWVYSGGGHPETPIEAPGSGLYYMWLKFQGSGAKDLYAYVLVDALSEEISLESISLPRTMTVNMGSTLKLEPTFNPSTATNKTVTWSSSDESVATVDSEGNVTPVSVGSTIITVTSEDGSITASCTVDVTDPTANNENNNTGDEGKDDGKDETVAPEPIPQTGEGIAIIVLSGLVITGITIAYIKFKKLKDIK